MTFLARRPALATPVLLLFSSCASSLLAPPQPPRAEVQATPEPVEEAEGTDEEVLTESAWEGFREPETAAPDDVVGLRGEYEPVERVLFGWHAGNWQYFEFFADMMRAVLSEARVLVAVESDEERIVLMHALASEGVDPAHLDFVIHQLDSMWIRDYGPVLVRTRDGGYRVIDLPYHADRVNDDRYPARFAEHEGLPVSRPALEMEGGHIQSDSEGRCIITDDVLVRNEAYAYDEDDVRRMLRRYFGCRQVTIVPALFAEETGHVDVLAYVTGPARVIVGSYRPEQDLVNSRRLNRAARLLREAGFTVTRIPMPDNRRRRTFRTYTNVLVLNRMVLVPVFRRDRRRERQALRTLAAEFPDRRIVPIAADGVMGLAGALHCTAIAVPELRPPRLVRRARRPRPRRRG